MTNGRGKPCKTCETPASRKRKWFNMKVGDIERLETRQPYYIPPWKSPLDIKIALFKEETEKHHATDEHITHIRIYTDGSGLNNRVTTTAVTPYNYTATQLGCTGDTQMYHGKLLKIALTLQQETSSDKTNSITIYSDS
jgi:hypothetical protein